MDYKNLTIRTISGAVLVGTIVGAILWRQESFFVLFIVISALTAGEFRSLTGKSSDKTSHPAIGCILLFASVYFHFACKCNINISKWLLIAYGVWLCGIMVAELWRKQPDPIADWANTVLTQIYVALPFALLNLAAFYHGEYQPILVLSLFILIWTNDTFAYLTGSILGRRRMFERISPKKSWEGFIGGNLFALGAGYLISIFEPALTWWQWLLFAEIVVISGTLGDLMESLLKRTLKVKDSGNSIPGHGGWLDRFDSLMLATPAVVMYLYLLA